MDEVVSQVASEESPTITFSIPAQFESQIIKEVKLAQPEKVIALTFDDGPWPQNTVQILDILKRHNVKATFFWVGECLKAYPQLAKQVVAEGHAIGNHTWHHLYRKFSKTEAAKEIEDTAELIYKTTGVRTSLFRPPGGVMDNGVTDYAKQKKYAIVMWSDDPMDYRAVSVQQLVKHILAQARSGGIVLLHDGGGNRQITIQALPQLIAKLKEQGYNFVTVPELLELKDRERLQEGAVETPDPMFDPWTLIENEGNTTR
ncbi:MAG TPA: polysaccharide deacetylase [Cyanobacteria bacterium UBA8803]|nr:polysaccharide deacetylase [Cyanobacteria bacterium UBA9273]HBL58631.1 polysaccharide deacetylase [Cyanobacteria bacterium UBA8803]